MKVRLQSECNDVELEAADRTLRVLLRNGRPIQGQKIEELESIVHDRAGEEARVIYQRELETVRKELADGEDAR